MSTISTDFRAPFFRVLQGSKEDMGRARAEINGVEGADLRIVRARKMTRRSALFDEMAAALQFPWYFGENWDAFEECICDLEWLKAQHVLVMVAEAPHLLREDSDHVGREFSSVMRRAAEAHAAGGIRTLHLIFHTPTGEALGRVADWFAPLRPL